MALASRGWVACIAVLAIGFWTTATAGAAETTAGAAETKAAPHVRPSSGLQQIVYCVGLVDEGAAKGVLKPCFGHAADLLEEGLRVRRSTNHPGGELSDQLELGVRQIIDALRKLPFHDRERLGREVDALEASIGALRSRLSRDAAAEHVQLSLVSRGGVSLGSWQAGFLFSVTEWAKTRPGQRRTEAVSDPAFSTVTGASAGAVNGFAAAIESCREPNRSATDSLYYRVWTDLGLFGRHGQPGLLPGPDGGSTALSLFTGEALEATLGKARTYLESGKWLPSCGVDYGFVTTHLDKTLTPVHVAEDGTPVLTTRKLKEKFAVRLDFDEPSETADDGPTAGELEITNLAPSGRFESDRIYYAGLGHAERVPLSALMMGVRASGAFPAAFPPVSMEYVEFAPGPDDSVRPMKRVDTFIDGGVLDNTPVGLAVTLDQWRREGADRNAYLDGLLPADPRTYIFLEPSVTSWSAGSGAQPGGAAVEADILKTYVDFAGALVGTTMDAQLTNTAEQYPFMRRARSDWIEPRLTVPRRHMPIAGQQFAHFMAFLERDFRIFDFYVGMADAYVYLAHESCLFAPDAAACEVAGDVAELDAEMKQQSALYRCMRDYYDSDEAKTMERISTRDLPDSCSDLFPVECGTRRWKASPSSVRGFLASRTVVDTPEPDSCIEPSIANHNFRVLIASMHNYKVWMQSEEYSEKLEFDLFFDELGDDNPDEQFIFVDLPTYQWRKDGYLDAAQAKQALRDLMQVGLNALAAEQEGPSRLALLVGGRAAADVAYERHLPRKIVGVGVVINGFEGVYGQRLWRSRWRWDTTFRFFRLQRSNYAAGLTPFTGELYLSTQATRIFSPTSYADIELGAGWALADTLAMSGPAPGQVALQTGPRTYAALVLLQRVYVAVNVDYYPWKVVDHPYYLTPNPVVDDWTWSIAGGWRFLY